MTDVTFDVDVDTLGGFVAATGKVSFTPWPGPRFEGNKLVLPGEFDIAIPTTPTFVVGLAPTTDAWCWRVRFETRKAGGSNVETYFVQVPAEGPVQFAALVHVDPRSLEPGAKPGAAWDLAMAELTELVHQFEGAQPEVIEQAVLEYLSGNPISGLPAGGTSGQVLAKVSGDDADAEWVTPPSGTWGDLDGMPEFIGAGPNAAEARAAIEAAGAGDLAGKADATHTHSAGDIDGLATAIADAIPDLDVTIEDVDGLEDALGAKASTGHTHTQDEIANLTTTLAGKMSTTATGNRFRGIVSETPESLAAGDWWILVEGV